MTHTILHTESRRLCTRTTLHPYGSAGAGQLVPRHAPFAHPGYAACPPLTERPMHRPGPRTALGRNDRRQPAQRGGGGRRALARRLPRLLRDCAGGRELLAQGYPEDVEAAAALDSSRCVPVLVDDRLCPTPRSID